MSSTIVFRRDAGNYYVFAQYPRPNVLPADGSVITDYKVDLYDVEAAAFIATDVQLTYVAAVRGFLSAARAKSELDAKEWVIVSHKPTSGDAAVQPFSRFVHVADILKRQDEIEAKEDVIKAAVDSNEVLRAAEAVTNQAEHDATQALLNHATFGLAAQTALLDAVGAGLVSLHVKVGTNADAAGSTTVFARLRQAVDSYLADATHGLAALNVDLDALLSRLGLTADTGGTTTAGSTMAKLNALLANPGGSVTHADVEVLTPTPPEP